MSKTYFAKDYTNFFQELEDNNHKPWFDENRKRYHEVVKTPFDNLVKDLLVAVHKYDNRVEVPYNKCIFRINRDIRFAKDKAPYKLNRSAIISPYGTKDKAFPGLYFEISATEFRIYGGVYRLDTQQVLRVREEIEDHLQVFQGIYKNSTFKKTFGKIQGLQHKRVPKEFEATYEKEPLILNKNWYVWTTVPHSIIYSDQLLPTIMSHYKILQKFNHFFERPIIG